jgi:hypothetical protein
MAESGYRGIRLRAEDRQECGCRQQSYGHTPSDSPFHLHATFPLGWDAHHHYCSVVESIVGPAVARITRSDHTQSG